MRYIDNPEARCYPCIMSGAPSALAKYRIPGSRLWDFLRESIKPALKKTGGAKVYHTIAEKYHWGKVFLNYLLMRNRRISQWLNIGAWPQSLYIEGTNICNASCVFCAYPQMERPKKIMPIEDYKQVIDQYVRMGGDEVDLTPIVGDPFVDRYLFDRMDYLDSIARIRRFHFFTNAILMKPDKYMRMLRYGAKLTVYVSFGGFDRETYRRVMGVDKFQEVADSIRGFIEAKRNNGSRIGIQVNLRIPPGNNQGEFWEYLQACVPAGLITIDSVDAFDSWAGMIRDQDLRLAGLAPRPMPVKKGPCHRLITSPVVLADGRVNACACRDVEAQLIIGDLKSQTLDQVLSGSELHDLIERHDRGDLPEVCRRCTYHDSLYPHWMQGCLHPLFARVFGGGITKGLSQGSKVQ